METQQHHSSYKIPRSTNIKSVIDIARIDAVSHAVSLLASGNIIALPTDTVYGFACNANDPLAIKLLYAIKGRSNTKPVAICVSEVHDFFHWGDADHIPKKLLDVLLPGPVTLVVSKSKHLSIPYLNSGLEKIGIRIPNAKFIRDVTSQFNAPIALTSANLSFQPSTLDIHEFKTSWPQLGAVFDGGRLGHSAASTVIDLSQPGLFAVLRYGAAIDHTIATLERYGLKRIEV